MGLDATSTRSPRRRPLAAMLVASALIVLALAGCSAMSGASDGGGVPEGVVDDGGVEGGGEIAEEGRSVIVEGWMAISVDDVVSASADAQGIVARAGGRIDAREESTEEGGEWSTLTLRVPAAALDAVVEDLRGLGEVDRVSTSSTDVTGAVRDVDARIAALETTLQRLTAFQDKATRVDDLLEIEREVSARQAELEKLRAEQQSYAERVDYSSLELELHPVGTAQPLPGTFGDGFVTGWNALVAFVGVLLVVFGAMLPWLVVAGLLTVLIIWLVRLLGRAAARRRAARAPEVAPQGGPPAGQPVMSQGEREPSEAPPAS
ncbi:DUF4349 domain-containing protein [Microbacterium sp. LjRoot45]|uniref:DUF4349 domain-containing protein n=1 Tax=Microbacterium sp. LjRoot45 TaxID=3342329 RepID=UPI003ED071C3